jgi:hypothetical protein
METEESEGIQGMERCSRILGIADEIKQFIRDREFNAKEALLATGFVYKVGADRIGGGIRNTMNLFMMSQVCVRQIDEYVQDVEDEVNAEDNIPGRKDRKSCYEGCFKSFVTMEMHDSKDNR